MSVVDLKFRNFQKTEIIRFFATEMAVKTHRELAVLLALEFELSNMFKDEVENNLMKTIKKTI